MIDADSIRGFRRKLQGYQLLDGGNLSARPKRRLCFLALFVTSVTVVSAFWLFIRYPRAPPPRPARLHLLVPATSSNENLCRLFLSAFAPSYPTPVLINWAAPESPDKFVQHVAKVQGISDYLAKLQRAGKHKDDLVLILDGYDVWFQLGPDVLLKRYFATTRLLDKQARQIYGEKVAVQRDMRHTILFGPDKMCWPSDLTSPACWALPKPQLAPFAFGPHTENRMVEPPDYNMPRWLNSGTILGPIEDLQRMFAITLQHIRDNFTKASDQFYFAEVFGAQEEARLRNRPELLQAMWNDALSRRSNEGSQLASSPAQSSEFHIGLDHRSTLFQTVGMYQNFLMWAQTRYTTVSPRASEDERRLQAFYHQDLPSDIASSPPPFSTLRNASTSLSQTKWSEVNLLHNTVTRTIPVVIHFTSAKLLRGWWWEKDKGIWFSSQARALHEAYAARSMTAAQPLSSSRIDGKTWYAGGQMQAPSSNASQGAGVWSDQGQWLTWEATCQRFEEEFY
ncbi:hypothetical protein K461DRAFT_322248 [Myriangium duriaei CBS 260.36]|uniref:Uncharacterized protein n=1 Tax=Myriangium duriaei CBS 260.36 TaxID=1168546 RepID=A0A9P4MGI6_9PEZI|nr:hypothetical protein K461DRAFT_322248 [Myriangium duriaei CBS 260.36]